MKALLLAILSLCLALSVVAVSQDAPPNQAPRKIQAAAGGWLTTIMGTIIQDEGDKLRFVTDQRAWNVDNPETLKGHEGHYVRVKAHVYPGKDSIHIIEVKMPTAGETKKNDMKQAP
jgi:opacity protein-like surface antigen